MGRAGVGSAYNPPLRVIPQRGKVCKYVCSAATSDSCNVFQEHRAGSKVANKTPELEP
jgi:hypothetical protein